MFLTIPVGPQLKGMMEGAYIMYGLVYVHYGCGEVSCT